MDQPEWGERTLESEGTRYFSICDLHIWIRMRDDEIWIAHAYQNECKLELNHEGPPPEIEWARWANKFLDQGIKILPVFPDLPLVVSSDYSLKISPNTKIKIFTRIPLWVQISVAKNDYHLVELPTVKLSRTWFGTPIEGELCYAATTKARRDLSSVDKKPYVISCPIIISNKSYEELNFDNFCYRLERLSIYQKDDELWADETQIIYQGEDLHSDVIMSGKLAEGVEKKNILSNPRKQVHKSLATRTFKRLLEETQIIGR